MFPFRKKEFFTEPQKEQLVQAVREAERLTSGEVRVFVESRCAYVEPLDRAKEIFLSLNMQQTKQRNAVILYIALKDRQFAIFGDEGIHQKVGDQFWKNAASRLTGHFKANKIIEGMTACIHEIGASLQQHFPYESNDQNELPDDIVFGK